METTMVSTHGGLLNHSATTPTTSITTVTVTMRSINIADDSVSGCLSECINPSKIRHIHLKVLGGRHKRAPYKPIKHNLSKCGSILNL